MATPTTCSGAKTALNTAVTSFLSDLNRANNSCFGIDFQNNSNDNPNSLYLSFETSLTPVYSGLADVAKLCPLDTVNASNYSNQLYNYQTNAGIDANIEMNCSILNNDLSNSSIATNVCWVGQAFGISVTQTCRNGCIYAQSGVFHSTNNWLNSGGLIDQIIALSTFSTITFANNTSLLLTSSADAGAFTSPSTDLARVGNVWQIGAGKIDAEGTIGDVKLLTAVPFLINNTQIFTLDFTKSPVAVTNMQNSGFFATTVGNGIGGSVITVSIKINFNLTGGLSQIIQEMSTPTNAIIISYPNSISINFVKSINTTQQNIFQRMLSTFVGANISIGSTTNIETICSSRPPSLGGLTTLALSKLATFLNIPITNSLIMGFSPQSSLTQVSLSTNSPNIAFSNFPSGQAFSISKTSASVNLNSYTVNCARLLNTIPLGGTGINVPAPLPVSISPLYTFSGTGLPNIGSNINTGTINGSSFSFTFALPQLVPNGISGILAGSSIQIIDSTQPTANNKIIFNIVGATVTGSIYGVSITGTASASLTGTPILSIKGNTPSGLLSKTFTFNTGITGTVNLIFN